MSEFLQSGLHPDADQLSAFAEGALPAHEREQTLDHLAGCSRCRAVVALALPPVDELATPLPQPGKARWNRWVHWFSGWNLAWSMAAALTATVLVTVSVYRAATTPRTPAQMATAKPTPPAAAPDQSLTARLVTPQPMVQSGERSQANAGVDSTHLRTTLAEKPLSTTPAEARESASIDMAKERKAPGQLLPPPVPSGITDVYVAIKSLSRLPPPSAVFASNPKIVVSASVAPQLKAAAPSRAASMQPVTISADQVAVETTSAAAGEVITGMQVRELPLNGPQQLEPRLPSGLPVVSQVAQGRMMLAIDASHAVFFSEDAGKRWMLVRTPWTGRAVKAALISSGAVRSPHAEIMSDGMQGGVAGGIFGGKATSARTAEGSLSGSVTDANGAAIVGAKITATANATDVKSTTASSGLGAFSLAQLAVGTYTVRISAPGFKEFVATGVEVHGSTNTSLNAALRLGAAAEHVTVQADAVQVETTSAAAGEMITGQQVRELPLNGENFVGLTQLSPGVSAAAKSAAKPAAPTPPTAVFEIVTDRGENWTSVDGLTWTRRQGISD